jgi:hypothetical protein
VSSLPPAEIPPASAWWIGHILRRALLYPPDLAEVLGVPEEFVVQVLDLARMSQLELGEALERGDVAPVLAPGIA